MMTWIALMGLAGGALLTGVNPEHDLKLIKAGYFLWGAFAMGLLLHLLDYF